MFKDHETIYVAASVSLLWLFTLALAAYEIGLNRADSGLETVVAISYGVGAAVGLTLLTVGTFEVIMVLAKRLEKRLMEQARQEAKEEVEKRWKAWYESLPEEIKKNQPPPPDQD